jgi:NAD(P)-dependent dehydrogenase (short-subunit alcohol dehydrogenase family)
LYDDLRGQTVLITGAAQGLGFGIATEFARAGSRVIIADRNVPKAKAAAAELERLGHQAVALALDVTDAQSVRSCVQTAIDMFSRVHVLVNDAGVLTERYGQPTTEQHFVENYDVNVLGVWRMTHALLPHFKAHGSGKIVIVASIAGRTPYAETPAYCASKAAVINLTRSLAMTLGVHNINVNGVCPGAVPTEMTLAYRRDMPNIAELEPASLNMVALRRHAEPEDIGGAAVFLASSKARNITGQCLNVDAGLLMS